MTATQRADRDFWLRAAEQADAALRDDNRLPVFLCCRAALGGDSTVGYRRKAQLDLFRNPHKEGVWWATDGVDDRWPDIYGPAEGRILAACFLAAMCASGDV